MPPPRPRPKPQTKPWPKPPRESIHKPSNLGIHPYLAGKVKKYRRKKTL